MLFGPVFRAELVTTSRRPRDYAIRFLYGLMILFQVYLTYWGFEARFGRRDLRIDEMADFGSLLFLFFALLQGAVVLVLTPSLVGGAIAEERQRKTLHYLLASQLTGFEIVVGKLAARLLQVVVLVVAGLPIVALIGLVGGIDFELLLTSYAATLTTIYFLASLSILVSARARRPREAIAPIYALELLWLLGPTMLMNALPSMDPPWPTVGEWVNPALYWLACSSPFSQGVSLLIRGSGGGMTRPVVEMMATQVAYGTILVLIAASRLRPAFRNEGAKRPRARWLGRLTARRRWGARPPMGDDAMLWKERFLARSTGPGRIVRNVLAVGVLAYLGYPTYWFSSLAAGEMWQDGFFAGGHDRDEFNMFLKVASGGIYVLWLLGLAGASANGVTGEREEDTWVSLTSTGLDGAEILRAKMLGPAWGLRGLAYLLGVLWSLGLAVGAVHPLGVLACSAEFVVFGWFLVALGTTISLHAGSSTKALGAMMAALIFLNGGYLACCIPSGVGTAALGIGITPLLFCGSLASYRDVSRIFGGGRGPNEALVVLGSLVLYGLAAAGLTTYAAQTFDAAVDRPNRLRQWKELEWVNPDRRAKKPPMDE